jgi:polar amino acid transport system substrate-binding protein
MAMGVYRDEVTGVRQPRYPASADDLTVFMLQKWQPKWQGEKSLQGQSVVWRRGWAFEKYIAVTMQWHEIDSDEMALQLLGKERYRYYLTAGVLYADDDIPPTCIAPSCAGSRPIPSLPTPHRVTGYCNCGIKRWSS